MHLAAVDAEQLDLAAVGLDVGPDLVERLLDEDRGLDLREVVHRQQRLRERMIELARDDAFQPGTMDGVDQLQEQQGPLVAFALERVDERVELGYGSVELHTASSMSSSSAAMRGLKPSPHPSSPGST